MSKSNFVGNPLFFRFDDESGQPGEDWFYAELIERCYTVLSIGSLEEKDWGSLKFSSRPGRPRKRDRQKREPELSKNRKNRCQLQMDNFAQISKKCRQ